MDETLSRVSDAELLQTYTEQDGDANKTAELIGLSASQVRKRIARIRLAGGSHNPTVLEPANSRKNRLQELLDNSSIQVESIGSISHVDVGEYGAGIKNKDGEWEEHGLYTKRMRIIPHSPKFPLVQPATPTQITYSEAPRILKKVEHVVVLSDAQIGYLRDVQTGILEPTHDPEALEVSRQIIGAIQPSTVVGIGDWMDWPIFSRWQKRPEFFDVTQQSIQAGYEWKARMRAAAGNECRMIEIGSNHGLRPETFLLEYNREALGLTRAVRPGDTGAAEWPVHSEPFFLRYDELGIEFSGQYPGGEFFLFPDLVFLHAPPKDREFLASYYHGHTHHLTMKTNAFHGSERDDTGEIVKTRTNYFGYDVGCLCQVGSTINKKRLLVMRTPGDRARTDWAKGLAVIEYIDGKIPVHQGHLIRIQEDGSALFQGQQFAAPINYDESIMPVRRVA